VWVSATFRTSKSLEGSEYTQGTRDKVVPYHYASRVLALLGGSLATQTTYSPSSFNEAQISHMSMYDASDIGEEEAHVRLVTVDGAGHDLTSSHPQLIIELLTAFFGDADER
jgi:pimeloyl-ACP methyl ester carboxylesterase